jgi:hypothetical protein
VVSFSRKQPQIHAQMPFPPPSGPFGTSPSPSPSPRRLVTPRPRVSRVASTLHNTGSMSRW